MEILVFSFAPFPSTNPGGKLLEVYQKSLRDFYMCKVLTVLNVANTFLVMKRKSTLPKLIYFAMNKLKSYS